MWKLFGSRKSNKMKFASGDGSSSKSSSKNITTNRFSANYDPPIFNHTLDLNSEEEELNLPTSVDIADIKLRSKSIQEVASSQSTVNSIASSRLSLQQPIRSESNCSSVGRFSNSSSSTSQRQGLGSKSILSIPSTVTGTSGSLTSITAAAMSCPSGDDSCAINELLEGRMNLSVILPPELVQAALNSSKIRNGSKSDIKSTAFEKSSNTVCINVDRKTPMMDILVNIATQYRFNASKYRLSVDGHDFKASTPIGSLDVNQVSVVPKVNKICGVNSRHSWIAGSSECGGIGISSGGLVDSSSTGSNGNTGSICALNVPFQTTFRLQVNLPRNQLMVLRVSPNLTIAQVKSAICEKKELDGSKYHLTATEGRLLKLLDLEKPLSYYGVHEVNLISDRVLSELQHQMDTTQSTSSALINGHRDGGSSSGNHVARHPSNANSNGSAHSSSVNGKNIQPLASATNCSTTSDSNGKSRSISIHKKRPAPPPPSKKVSTITTVSEISSVKASVTSIASSIGSSSSSSGRNTGNKVVPTGKSSKARQECNNKSIEKNNNIPSGSKTVTSSDNCVQNHHHDSGSESSGYHESFLSPESVDSSSPTPTSHPGMSRIMNSINCKKNVVPQSNGSQIVSNCNSGSTITTSSSSNSSNIDAKAGKMKENFVVKDKDCNLRAKSSRLEASSELMKRGLNTANKKRKAPAPPAPTPAQHLQADTKQSSPAAHPPTSLLSSSSSAIPASSSSSTSSTSSSSSPSPTSCEISSRSEWKNKQQQQQLHETQDSIECLSDVSVPLSSSSAGSSATSKSLSSDYPHRSIAERPCSSSIGESRLPEILSSSSSLTLVTSTEEEEEEEEEEENRDKVRREDVNKRDRNSRNIPLIKPEEHTIPSPDSGTCCQTNGEDRYDTTPDHCEEMSTMSPASSYPSSSSSPHHIDRSEGEDDDDKALHELGAPVSLLPNPPPPPMLPKTKTVMNDSGSKSEEEQSKIKYQLQSHNSLKDVKVGTEKDHDNQNKDEKSGRKSVIRESDGHENGTGHILMCSETEKKSDKKSVNNDSYHSHDKVESTPNDPVESLPKDSIDYVNEAPVSQTILLSCENSQNLTPKNAGISSSSVIGKENESNQASIAANSVSIEERPSSSMSHDLKEQSETLQIKNDSCQRNENDNAKIEPKELIEKKDNVDRLVQEDGENETKVTIREEKKQQNCDTSGIDTKVVSSHDHLSTDREYTKNIKSCAPISSTETKNNKDSKDNQCPHLPIITGAVLSAPIFNELIDGAENCPTDVVFSPQEKNIMITSSNLHQEVVESSRSTVENSPSSPTKSIEISTKSSDHPESSTELLTNVSMISEKLVEEKQSSIISQNIKKDETGSVDSSSSAKVKDNLKQSSKELDQPKQSQISIKSSERVDDEAQLTSLQCQTSDCKSFDDDDSQFMSLQIGSNHHNTSQEQKVTSNFVRDLCRPRKKLTNFRIGSYKPLDNSNIYESTDRTDDASSDSYSENSMVNRRSAPAPYLQPQRDVQTQDKPRPKSLILQSSIKPIILDASLKADSSSSSTEKSVKSIVVDKPPLPPSNSSPSMSQSNTNTESESNSSEVKSSSSKDSLLSPQPYKLYRLESWGSKDAAAAYWKGSRSDDNDCEVQRQGQSISNRKSNNADFRQRIPSESQTPLPPPPPVILPNNHNDKPRCISQIQINENSTKVSIRNTITSLTSDTRESPISVITVHEQSNGKPSVVAGVSLPIDGKSKNGDNSQQITAGQENSKNDGINKEIKVKQGKVKIQHPVSSLILVPPPISTKPILNRPKSINSSSNEQKSCPPVSSSPSISNSPKNIELNANRSSSDPPPPPPPPPPPLPQYYFSSLTSPSSSVSVGSNGIKPNQPTTGVVAAHAAAMSSLFSKGLTPMDVISKLKPVQSTRNSEAINCNQNVPKSKKSSTSLSSSHRLGKSNSNSKTPNIDFHDALLREIRNCGGRQALRKVSVNR